MKKSIFLVIALLFGLSISGFSQITTSVAEVEETKWIKVACEDVPPELYNYLLGERAVKLTNPYSIKEIGSSDFRQKVANACGIADELFTSLEDKTDEFAQTFVGKASIFVILYHYLGKEAVIMTVCLLLLIVLYFAWTLAWKKMCIPSYVIEEEKKTENRKEVTRKVLAPTVWNVLVLFIVGLILTWILIGVGF
ncbi:hypothetical protein HOD29_02745 [archaeon]|jgi:hypothetical protein|nr:hypothetical protein [archaeon]